MYLFGTATSYIIFPPGKYQLVAALALVILNFQGFCFFFAKIRQ